MNELLTNPYMMMGMNILSQMGPSRMPVSSGQILGTAGLNTMQQLMVQKQQEKQLEQLDAQTKRLKSMTSNIEARKKAQEIAGRQLADDTPYIYPEAALNQAPMQEKVGAAMRTMAPHSDKTMSDLYKGTLEAGAGPEIKDVKVDDFGNWWGRIGKQVVPLNMGGNFQKWKQTQGTDAAGMPVIEQVNLKTLHGIQRNQPPSHQGTPLANPYGNQQFTPGRITTGKKGLPVETSGKLTMMKVAEKNFSAIEKLIFPNGLDKPADELNVFNMGVNMPRTDGRRARAMMEVGIQGITRTETGAAMPPGEVANTRLRFQPSILDDLLTKKVKWQMYKDFISMNIETIQPKNGIYQMNPQDLQKKLDEEFSRRMAEALSKESKSKLEDLTEDDLKNMSDEELRALSGN